MTTSRNDETPAALPDVSDDPYQDNVDGYDGGLAELLTSGRAAGQRASVNTAIEGKPRGVIGGGGQ